MAQQSNPKSQERHERVSRVVVRYLQYSVTAIPWGLFLLLIIWSGS